MEIVESLADLPIDVAEAMYSPDFVELATLSAGGTPVVLPMSFTLDIGANAVRFSSPVNAGRIANLIRDPRCCVSFTRVTAGYPPVVLEGVATLGDVAEGVRRGPARRFTVTPQRLRVFDESLPLWEFPSITITSPTREANARTRRSSGLPPTRDDLDAITRFETTVIGLREGGGWPLTVPAEIVRDGDALVIELPAAIAELVAEGPATVLGHTWTKDGPRYLALTCRASRDRSAIRCLPIRALRRP
ncbi:MAG: pyridoxamine 5'-phosphate oxidase family protein [Dehalococcoidia bacterium]